MPTLYSITTATPELHFICNYDFAEFTQQIGYDHKDYKWTDNFSIDMIETDSSNDAIFLLNVGSFSQFTVSDFRKFCPNGKLIAYCSSEEVYQYPKEYVWGPAKMDIAMFHPSSIEAADIFLCPNSNSNFFYSKHGILTDKIYFTISEWMIRKIDKYCQKNEVYERDNKYVDIIALIRICDSKYRQQLKQFLSSRQHTMYGFSIEPRQNTRWVNSKLVNPYVEYNDEENFETLFDMYNESLITLGTTSFPSDHRPKPKIIQRGYFLHHDIVEELRHMKGMRDWIGPLLNSVLICDDHPDVATIMNDNYDLVVPTYNYYDLESLQRLILTVLNNDDFCHEFLTRQKEWIRNNTFIKQLSRIFTKHNIRENNENQHTNT